MTFISKNKNCFNISSLYENIGFMGSRVYALCVNISKHNNLNPLCLFSLVFPEEIISRMRKDWIPYIEKIVYHSIP